ncbi:MAG TPA: hypothetical protein VGL19_10040, partial [Polyangiaceae bacterium]
QRLQTTLDALAQSENVGRRVTGWAFTGVGVFGGGAATYALVKSKDPHWLVGTFDGVLLATVGFEVLIQDGPFEYLAKYARNDPAHPGGTEQEWLRAGQAQLRVRHWAAGYFLVSAAAYSALAVVVAARQDGWHSNAEHYGEVATWFGVATASCVAGAWYLLSPSPVESALHDYEHSSGHTVTDGAGASTPQLRLGATPSGFMAALSGTF